MVWSPYIHNLSLRCGVGGGGFPTAQRQVCPETLRLGCPRPGSRLCSRCGREGEVRGCLLLVLPRAALGTPCKGRVCFGSPSALGTQLFTTVPAFLLCLTCPSNNRNESVTSAIPPRLLLQGRRLMDCSTLSHENFIEGKRAKAQKA